MRRRRCANHPVFEQGAIQDHVLQVSGGSGAANYLLSGGYFNQEGIIINSGFERYTFRANSELRRGRFTFGENVALARARDARRQDSRLGGEGRDDHDRGRRRGR